jgi:hypothetical protein
MYSKAGSIPFGEIRGLLVFMAFSLIFLLFFYGCIVKDEKEEGEQMKVSSGSLQLSRELYFIMESKLDNQDTIHEKIRGIFIDAFPSYNEGELKSELDQFYNDYFPDNRVLTIMADNDAILYDSYNRDPYYILHMRSSYGEYPVSFTDKEGYHYTITIFIQKK